MLRLLTKRVSTRTLVVLAFAICLICPLLLAADAAPPVLDAAAKVADTNWLSVILGLLSSAPAIAVIVGLIIKYALYLQETKKVNSERWLGLVIALYNTAEKAGLLSKWSGAKKLDYAMEKFEEEFKKAFPGETPTAQDIQDFKLDIARVAYADTGTDVPVTLPGR